MPRRARASSRASTPAPRPRASATSPTAPPPRRRGSREVYTRGTLTLARLGREAPIAAASPAGGPVLRNVLGGSLAARALYPVERPGRSPVIGTNAPVQYEERDADSSAV